MPRGHPVGEDLKRQICDLRFQGLSYDRIGKQLNIAAQTAHGVFSREFGLVRFYELRRRKRRKTA